LRNMEIKERQNINSKIKKLRLTRAKFNCRFSSDNNVLNSQ